MNIELDRVRLEEAKTTKSSAEVDSVLMEIRTEHLHLLHVNLERYGCRIALGLCKYGASSCERDLINVTYRQMDPA
jgi:phage gp36-like protein